MKSTESIRYEIYNAIDATSSEKGRITHAELEILFPHVLKDHADGDSGTAGSRTLRDIVLEIESDPEFGLIAEDVNGYFIPRTVVEIKTRSRELAQECEARNKAENAKLSAVRRKCARIFEASAGSSAADRTDDAGDERNGSSAAWKYDVVSSAIYPHYRLLLWDELIQQGDELSLDEGKTWFGTHFHGESVGIEEVGNYRRRVNAGEGHRLLNLGEILREGDESLAFDRWEATCDCCIGLEASVDTGIVRRRAQ